MKILVADDHAVLRKGLILILAEGFAGAEFGEAASTAETLERLTQQPWDVLVLDIFMPDRSGLDVLYEVRRHQPRLPVLVLSSAPEEQLAPRVLRAGASGYLNKQVAPEELAKAVRKVVTGGRYVSATLAERLAAELGQADRPLHECLSDREYAVLQRLVGGQSVKDIATAFSLSPKTVSTYHTRIWRKLGVRSDAELVRYALQHGFSERM